MFNAKINGLDEIDTDFDTFMHHTDYAVRQGLNAVTSDMTASLQEHVQKDVYDFYTPEVYIRRADHPQYGRSLKSKKNITTKFFNNSLEFEYLPSPINTHYHNSPHARDGDEMISIIENGEGYPWGITKIGARPFWSNFVFEQFADGKAEDSLVKGMNDYDRELKVEADRNIFVGANNDIGIKD